MTISKSKRWWKGSTSADIEEYLRQYSAESYAISAYRPAMCDCGGVTFSLDVDDAEEAARRTCVACGREYMMCDSGEYWADADPERCECPCGSSVFNIGVGFSLYPGEPDIRWLFIGCRCDKCGVLGCYADWKVAYTPSVHLLNLV